MNRFLGYSYFLDSMLNDFSFWKEDEAGKAGELRAYPGVGDLGMR